MDDRSYAADTDTLNSARSPLRWSDRPKARHDGFLVQEIGDEVVIYDQSRHQAHQLNRAAAWLWRHADGRTTIADLTKRLESELGQPVDAAEIALGLEQLASAQLLEDPAQWLSATMSRRRALVKLGVAGGLGVFAPMVKSIAAPDAAMAQYGDAQCEDEESVLSRMNGSTSDAQCEDDQGILSRAWWQ